MMLRKTLRAKESGERWLIGDHQLVRTPAIWQPRAAKDKPNEFASNIRELVRRQSSTTLGLDDTGDHALNFIGLVALESTREIDRLIDDLRRLCGKLEDEGNRVQHDVADYTSLSQSVVQLTRMVSHSMTHVRTFSDTPRPDMTACELTGLSVIEQE